MAPSKVRSSLLPSLPPLLPSFLSSYLSLPSLLPSLPPFLLPLFTVKARNVVSYRNTDVPDNKILQSTVSVHVDAQVRPPSPPSFLPPFFLRSRTLSFLVYILLCYSPSLALRTALRLDRASHNSPSSPPSLLPLLRSQGAT